MQSLMQSNHCFHLYPGLKGESGGGRDPTIGPQGDTGIRGPPGDPGARGPTGKTGPIGKPGLKGGMDVEALGEQGQWLVVMWCFLFSLFFT